MLAINVTERNQVRSRDDERHVLTQLKHFVLFVTFCTSVLLLPNASMGQTSVADFHHILRDRLAFDETDLAALQAGHTIVKRLPSQDKREIAVSGIVGLPVTAQAFLKSFRENMAAKSNPAILEIGRFSNQPTLDDLNGLSFETRDIEDLKRCVVGDCQSKLSASMIERLRKEMNWEAPDYVIKATQLLKLMLLDYVRDYLARGDVALIEYSDKEIPVRLAEEQVALKAASTYINGSLAYPSRYLTTQSNLTNIENAIVWSKIKFGLKPVISISHIAIYENSDEIGPQVLITSRQIYANHYFNSSLAFTAFVSVPGASLTSYLIYENRSRADGLGGPFGGIKRGIVADKAVSILAAVLDQSKARLTASTFNRPDSVSLTRQRTWRRWTFSGTQLFFCLLLITACGALLAFSNYRWKSGVS